MKLFLIVSILFCFWSVKILIDESNEVVYEYKNGTQAFESLFCFSFKKEFDLLIKNLNIIEQPIDLDELRNHLFNYFNSSIYEKKILTKFNRSKNEVAFFKKIKIKILDQIKSKNYHINRDYFCLTLDFKSKDNKMKFFENFKPDYFLFKRSTYYLFKLDYSVYFETNDIHQFIIYYKEYPYSNCQKNYSKYLCYSQCFKSNYRISKYFYDGHEKGLIYLNYENNQSITESEQNCFQNYCMKDDCELTHFVPSNSRKTSEYHLIPSLSNFEFYIEFIGLLLLFFNFSFYQIFLILMRSIRSNRLELIKFDLFIKIYVFLIFLVLNYCLFQKFYDDYLFKLENPSQREISYKQLEPEKITLSICINNSDNLDIKKILKTKGLSYYELEQLTNNKFNQTIKDIYLTFQNSKFTVDWRLSRKVLFLINLDYNISRCFLVQVYPTVPRYTLLLLNTKLKIESNNPNYDLDFIPYDLYLISKNQTFSPQSFLYEQYFSFIKIIDKKQLKNNNCLNYYDHNFGCLNQDDCFNKCLNRKIIEKNYSRTLYEPILIDKKLFNPKQWRRKIYLKDKEINDEIYFNKSRNFCKKNYSIQDCHRQSFEISINEKSYYTSDSNFYELNMNYDIIEILNETPSIYKLILDLLNIQNILFGFNAAKLLLMVFCFLKKKFKLKNNDFYLIIIYSVCLIGFSFHLWFIFDEIITGELIKSQHYEILKEIDIQDIVFCFNYNESLIDINVQLTGNYLEEITKDLKIETVFDRIVYLNKFNQWITLNSTSNFTNDDLKIDTFYLLNKKCFVIQLDIIYKLEQFHFSAHTDVLRVFFNDNLQKKYHFLSKRKNTLHFSKMLSLEFQKFYVVKQQLFEINHNDKFNRIKNPFLLFYGENYLNDVNKYVKKCKDNFKSKYNLTTLNMVLDKEDFNLPIDDLLFQQYFQQVQNISDLKAHKNLNYDREFYQNFFGPRDFSTFGHNSGFIFNLIFLKKVLQITNEDNYAKLILNLISVISFWLNVAIIDTFILKIKLIYRL